MKSKKADMQAIFSRLSEENKDIVILAAKSVKAAQGTTGQAQAHKPSVDRPWRST